MSIEKHTVGLGGIAYIHLLEYAVFGAHGGVAQLYVAHLTKTFIARYGCLAVVRVDESLHLLVGPAIFLGLTALALVQGRVAR